MRKTPDIDKWYNKLIMLANSLVTTASFSFGIQSNLTIAKMQQILIDLQKLSKSLIGSKRGLFHRAILGKSIDYGMRSVISTSDMSKVQLPKDNPVDVFHSGIPLAQCIVTGYPFILRWLNEYFREQYGGGTKVPALLPTDDDRKFKVAWKNSVDQRQIYTKQVLEKRMERFISTYSSRFEPVDIYISNADGRIEKDDPVHVNINATYNGKPVNRVLTWLDLFYMAAVEALATKYVYLTRYPITGIYNTFPTQIAVLSTYDTLPLTVNGKFYKHYPNIDPDMDEKDIEIAFIDTVTMSNHYLDAIGGDYDGDQISLRIVFSDEANREAEQIMKSTKMFLDIQGKLFRNVKNEAYQTFYMLTAD
jgi:hypothetical protein